MIGALLLMATITVPHHYDPRPYQLPLLQAMDRGCKRAVQVWHRRAGKDKTDLNLTVKKMTERVGTYFHTFPELKQGRKILWDGLDRDGFAFRSHFPYDLLACEPNSSDMKITLRNGSIWQIVGSDNYAAALGSNPVGIVHSEYSISDPACRNYFRPILAENGGWEIVNFTPRGENHAYDLWELAKSEPFDPATGKGWFGSLLTVDDTRAIPQHVLDDERREVVRLNGNDALFLQEYYCSFAVPISGAYYAEQLSAALRDGRVGHVPHEPRLAVDTFWDLGINDRMAIWFTQSVGAQIRVIDFMDGTGQGLPHYIAKLKEKPYVYGRHVAPPDIEVRELGTGKSRRAVARDLGVDFEVAPRMPIADGIEAVRGMFASCWFDRDHCRDGLNALKNYRKQYDEKRKTYLSQPYHDWSSNAADAFRYRAVAMDIKHQSGSARQPDKYERAAERRPSSSGIGILG